MSWSVVGEVAKTTFPVVAALGGVWLTQVMQNRREAQQSKERRYERLAAQRLEVYTELLEWIEETLRVARKWSMSSSTEDLQLRQPSLALRARVDILASEAVRRRLEDLLQGQVALQLRVIELEELDRMPDDDMLKETLALRREDRQGFEEAVVDLRHLCSLDIQGAAVVTQP